MATTNTYAVLLRDVAQPSAEAIRHAFRAFSHLTDVDAIRLAANAQGILLRHLGVDEAKALQQALLREGVKAALVKDEDLRFLPASQRLHRIELTQEALVIYDYVGRATPLAWGDFSLVAAGAVPHVEISSVPTPPAGRGLKFAGWPRQVVAPRTRLETERQFILELIVGEGAARYEIQAHDFPFKCVVERPEDSLVQKFVWLVRELTQRVPRALLNRAAQDIQHGVPLVRGYPSRQQMLDEMVWLLWSRAHPPAGG